jgi:hypothetical protein
MGCGKVPGQNFEVFIMQRRFLPVAAALAVAASFPTLASTPASHNVTAPATAGQVVTAEWTGSIPPGAAGGGNTCVSGVGTDGHTINLTVPAGAYDTVKIKADFHIEWDDGDQDLVLSVEQNGSNIGDSDGGTPEENVSANNPPTAAFNVLGCAFLATAPTSYRGKVTLTATSKFPPPDEDADGVLNETDVCPGTPAASLPVDADGCPSADATGLPPRFQVHVAPPTLGNDAGEPSVGFNKHSQHSMFISYVNALRQTYQEDVLPTPLLPASCDATWEDKSGLLTTVNSLDPILFTDEQTGRTWNSQLSGDNSLMEFTDNDGESWTPAQVGPPNGGADHQTVASGPYPTGSAAAALASWPATGPKRAVYYCSQSVATAFCSRSDDGGVTFGQGNNFKNLDCAAGALHGHVKVAPDGTVYVPDSSQCVLPVGGTADQVIAFMSEDAGVTWEVRDLPGSVGGAASDPSLGIATDGSLYMCYENGDSHVHMAVSHDKGATWINDKDLGAAHGIVQTRFPQAVAGDNGRAACAFLGTTTPGNGSSLAFEGVWHGYIATTYDDGLTYHVQNVTPLDPVQGYGGICGEGTCRNLLDFNDLQIDDEGRLLFAYADGCTGPCVTDPSANAFEAKASIVRQTGGRTLYAAKDNLVLNGGARFNNPTTLKPAEPCARQDLSSRNYLGSDVRWNAPDTGGARISGYRVYRSESASGPFTLVGSTNGERFFHDATTRPSVEKYYYNVDAINAVGTSAVGNTIELLVTVGGSSCELPGIFTVADAEDDQTTVEPSHDIHAVYFAEPFDQSGNLVATLKVAAMDPATPNTMWAVRFDAPTGPPNGELGWWIGLSTADAAETWVYGSYRVDVVGVASVTVYTILGEIDPDSSYAADGTITLIADKAIFGLTTGNTVSGVLARTGPVSSNSSPIAGAAQDDTGTGFYQLRGSDICATPGVPVAELKANVNEGDAPLAVLFTMSGVQTEGKALKGYSLDFGDGSTAATGLFNGANSVSVEHVYAGGGVFRARLTITDEFDTASTNLAEETITVLGDAKSLANGNNRLGGAFPAFSLAALGLLALVRRRRRQDLGS